MSFFVLTKLFASIVTGMLGIPLGILPSIFLFRGLANGVDDSEATKKAYAMTLWSGMVIAWILARIVSWNILTILFG